MRGLEREGRSIMDAFPDCLLSTPFLMYHPCIQ